MDKNMKPEELVMELNINFYETERTDCGVIPFVCSSDGFESRIDFLLPVSGVAIR